MDDKDAKAIPKLPRIETYACAANRLGVDLSSSLGTKIIDPG